MKKITTNTLSNTSQKPQEYADKVKILTGIDPISLAFTAAMNLKSSAAHNAGQGASGMIGSLSQLTCCVIPITAGKGAVSGFAASVEALLSYVGVQVLHSETADVEGIYRAWEYGADIVFLADDDRYIAMNLRNGKCCENDAATAYGFTAALEEMAGGSVSLRKKSVLLIGCGRVGRIAAEAIRRTGAYLALYDRDMLASRRLKTGNDRMITDPKDIAGFAYILDATNEGGWLAADFIKENAVISMPGAPLSFAFDAKERPDVKLFHDALYTGTLVMLEAVL